MILASPCRQSIRKCSVYFVKGCGYDGIQALVAGCPLLSILDWEDETEAEHRDEALESTIESLLKSRGGGWDSLGAFVWH